jgi:hypothetical protein
LWLAETSQQPISQTTWLKVTPHCNHCNHCRPEKKKSKNPAGSDRYITERHLPPFIKKKKTTQAVKTTPHIIEGKGATMVPSTVKLLHREKERKNQWGSGGLQAWPETGS